MHSSIVYLVGLLAVTSTASPTLKGCPRKIGVKGVSVRLPPRFDPNYAHSKWVEPPLNWYFKPWYTIYATNEQYVAFRNLQYDPTAIDPLDPAGPVNDLFSFQLKNNDTIHTTYGVDTPNPKYPAVLSYNATGIIAGATSEYSILTWGCDATGAPYYSSYSTETVKTKTPAGIDILSVNPKGPDEATTNAILNALENLNNEEIKGWARNLTKVAYDGARDGQPRTVCDDYCKTNQNLLGLLG
ncbi:hypothetical protein T440DRAFT_427696 [Plenodomus tracheiphilus IPT5]|uniref:Uncharacterized protein n=1 Tax=Plenodomus tracheiphilus IPT5 TaxID=1408161 RepID=A0A6A7B2U4_9PLEO|nr:hypothetical protein T440DRAFT_427696 [Plenodomus tracheiphilus IPT5]